MFKHIHNRALTCVKILLAITDIIFINIILITSVTLFSPHSIFIEGRQQEFIPALLLEFNLIALLIATFLGLYKTKTIEHLESIFRTTAMSGFFLLFIFGLCAALAHNINNIKYILLILSILITLYCVLSRFLLTLVYSTLFRRYNWNTPVALIGDRNYIQLITNTLDPKNPFFTINTIQYRNQENLTNKEVTLKEFKNYFEACQQQGIYDVIIVNSPEIANFSKDLLSAAVNRCLQLSFISPKTFNLGNEVDTSFNALNTPVIRIYDSPMATIESRLKKRLMDILISGLVIVLILSWLTPIIAIIIKLQSPGPVFFKQLRSGRNNKTFYCYKFRSMVVNDKSSTQQADKHDSRVTPIGRFLRRTNLDEFPQFINVFLGQMSIVGPRPHMLFHTEYYGELIKNYMRRHYVKPGITGWAQINGFRGETKDSNAMVNRVEYDLDYINNWSTLLDIKIIFLTAINMIRGDKNAY